MVNLKLTALLAVVCSLVGVLTVLADDKPLRVPKRLEIESKWDARSPVNGAPDASVAAIPPTIITAIVSDFAPAYDDASRPYLVKLVEKQLMGTGHAAAFTLERTQHGDLTITSPRIARNYVLNGPANGFEIGMWQAQPEARALHKVPNGYRWMLPWVIQLGCGDERRAYQVDVLFTRTLDRRNERIHNQAVWRGPLSIPPRSLEDVLREQKTGGQFILLRAFNIIEPAPKEAGR